MKTFVYEQCDLFFVRMCCLPFGFSLLLLLLYSFSLSSHLVVSFFQHAHRFTGERVSCTTALCFSFWTFFFQFTYIYAFLPISLSLSFGIFCAAYRCICVIMCARDICSRTFGVPQSARKLLVFRQCSNGNGVCLVGII